jgi:hypothetical protein
VTIPANARAQALAVIPEQPIQDLNGISWDTMGVNGITMAFDGLTKGFDGVISNAQGRQFQLSSEEHLYQRRV